MTLIDVLILLLIAGICGSIGQSIVGYSHGGCIVSIVLGFIGAYVGKWIANKMDLPGFFTIHIGNTSFPVVWSIVGAIVFTGIISLLFRKRNN